MKSYEELNSDLEKFKNNESSEYDLKPIQKWMEKELGVKRLKNPRGSKVRFEHAAFLEWNDDSCFMTHVLHKGKEQIRRANFRNYLYKDLKTIIEYMRKEGLCGDERH